jgi:hypothetical protein
LNKIFDGLKLIPRANDPTAQNMNPANKPNAAPIIALVRKLIFSPHKMYSTNLI